MYIYLDYIVFNSINVYMYKYIVEFDKVRLKLLKVKMYKSV